MTFVIPLTQCTRERAPQVGGKAVGLGAMLAHGLPVPAGFAITTDAYRAAVESSEMSHQIAVLLEGLDPDRDMKDVAAKIQGLFHDAMISSELAAQIDAAYEALGDGAGPCVAVRSSATAEDMAEASFAGQQDTYLWVQGREEVRRHVVLCWASLFTPRAITYRARLGVPLEGLAMGVVVQKMVPARVAGVMMTLEPVTGDRSQIYVESTYGVGEGVVRGDVGTDRFWVTKADLGLHRQEIGQKEQAHRAEGLVAVPQAEQRIASLAVADVLAVAELGRRVEEYFGAPMDVEWAIAQGAPPGEVALLQARPETVWSRLGQPVPATASGAAGMPDYTRFDPRDDWDPLHSPTRPGDHWSTDNMGEAAPGVLTPLALSFHATIAERSPRRAHYRIGVRSRHELTAPTNMLDRTVKPFFGRIAMKVEFLAEFGNRMPGLTGEAVVTSIFGRAPDTIDYTPTKRRYPVIAVKLPYVFLTYPNRVRRLAKRTDAWWARETTAVATRDLAGAQATLAQSADTFLDTLATHVTALMGVITPLFGFLGAAVARAGTGDISVLSGVGGAESEIVHDIWRASRGEIQLDEVVARHGFHGPAEGEVSSTVWREDPSPLRRMVQDYASRPESASPVLHQRERQRQADAMRAEVIAATPRLRRPQARLVLSLAARHIPLRGVGKRSFVQSLDVARASARRIGELYTQRGLLEQADDAFYLTLEELVGPLPADARELVARRRARRIAYQAYDLPSHWTGEPVPIPAGAADTESRGAGVVSGIGVSAGVVEGVVRVVTSPDFAEVRPDEVLVAPTTDPSWSSIMFVSCALVVDIGSALSHAAVVARELGLPCVVNTRSGTRALRTGDRVRVDGGAGTVTILERAGDQAAAPAS